MKNSAPGHVTPLRFLAETLRQAPRSTHVSLVLAACLVLFSAAWMMASLEFSRMTLQAVRVDLYQGELDDNIRWLLEHAGIATTRASLVLGIAAIAVAFLAYVISFCRDCLFDRIALGVVLRVRHHAMQRVLGYRYADLVTSDPGSISKRIFHDISMLQRLLVECLLLRVVDAVLLISCLAYLFVLQPMVAILAGALVLVHAAVAVMSALLVQVHVRRADHASERLWSRLAQLLGRLRMVRAVGAEEQEMSGLSHDLHAETRARRTVGIFLFFDKALTGLLHFSGPVLILMALVLASGQSGIQIETFVVLVMVLGMMFSAADNLTAVFMDLSRIEVATDNIQALLGVKAEHPGRIDAISASGTLPPPLPLLKIENLRFRYPAAAKGLHIRELAIWPGEKVALLGGSGLGKSTLLELIVGLHDDYEGHLGLGPWSLQHGSSSHAWRQQISYLPAAIELVEGDVYDNLFYGRARPDHVEKDLHVQSMLRLFGLDALSPASLPQSAFDASRGKHQMSTGQIRRIQLVHTLLRETRLALLDEPVAPLASGDRLKAMAHFFDLLKPDVAALVVTHQTDILPLFDRVIVLGELASGEIGIVQTWKPQAQMDSGLDVLPSTVSHEQ